MVTLRRDIAAAGTNPVFDRADYNVHETTGYDLYMEQKAARDKARTEYSSARTANASGASDCFHMEQAAGTMNLNYFGQTAEMSREQPRTASAFSDFTEYMRAQLNRETPEQMMTEEEFYVKKFGTVKTVKEGTRPVRERAARKTEEKSARKKLSKNAKIFIAIYVLVVVAVASIILAVNRVPQSKSQNAAHAEGQEIAAMEIPSEAGTDGGNWFDKLLDGVTNG